VTRRGRPGSAGSGAPAVVYHQSATPPLLAERRVHAALCTMKMTGHKTESGYRRYAIMFGDSMAERNVESLPQ